MYVGALDGRLNFTLHVQPVEPDWQAVGSKLDGPGCGSGGDAARVGEGVAVEACFTIAVASGEEEAADEIECTLRVAGIVTENRSICTRDEAR